MAKAAQSFVIKKACGCSDSLVFSHVPPGPTMLWCCQRHGNTTIVSWHPESLQLNV